MFISADPMAMTTNHQLINCDDFVIMATLIVASDHLEAHSGQNLKGRTHKHTQFQPLALTHHMHLPIPYEIHHIIYYVASTRSIIL